MKVKFHWTKHRTAFSSHFSGAHVQHSYYQPDKVTPGKSEDASLKYQEFNLFPQGNAIYSNKKVQIGTFPEDRLLLDLAIKTP